MFWNGKNKFPLKSVCCCIGNRASKSTVDFKLLMTCGPETTNIVVTFFLMNVPLILFALFSNNFFFNDAYNLNNNNCWIILISV